MAGKPLHADTLAKLARIAPKTRTAGEFVEAASVEVRSPTETQGPFTWSLETIRAARDEQLRGVFRLPAQLALSLRTDDALFTAYHNRIAPQSALAAKLEPAPGARGESIARAAARSIEAPRSVLSGIHGTMANHGLAIGYVVQEVNEAGTRIDFKLTEWPIEFVRWDPSRRVLEATTEGGHAPETIVHGDSRWVVFSKFANAPWNQDACLLPASFIWAAHANGISDWAGASKAHGLAKILGELPEGVALNLDDSTLSPEARAMLTLLQNLTQGHVGVKPAGSKVEFLTSGSTAHEVFSQLIESREKAAARVYLGTDATLGSVGGAPGVDISQLFGVATTRVQGDIEALECGLNTGVSQPWTAMNHGSSRYAPRYTYELPDPDARQFADDQQKRRDGLFATLDQMEARGMVVDQEVVNSLATEAGLEAPQLAPTGEKKIPLNLAPTDVARAVRVWEVRAAQGLPPLGDSRDNLFLSQLEAETEAAAASPAPTPGTAL